MDKVAKRIVKKLARKLGGQLEAVYLFGSLARGQYQPEESDINLIAVLADGTSIHAMRKLFLPIWEEHGATLGRAPFIAEETTFAHYLMVAPTFAHHLIHEAKMLFGAPDYLDDWPETNPYDASARLAEEAMEVSAALTPELLPSEETKTQLTKLQRLARRLYGKPLEEGKTAAELFALVQYVLNKRIEALPNPPKTPGISTTTTLMLPGLQASYREGDTMVMVFQKLTPHQIMGIQWSALAQRLGSRCSKLLVTTTAQFELILEFERPLDLCFNRYQHEWGAKPVDRYKISRRQMLRHAARRPAAIQIDELPNAYLTGEDGELHKIVHDFQNKLLNVQLEHELLHRTQELEKFTPPEPLPGREAPLTVRIDAIHKHLGWWAEYYTNEMLKLDQE